MNKGNRMIQEYLNTKDVANLLGVSISTIKRLRKSLNEGPKFSYVGHQVRYKTQDVRNWMEANQSRCKRDMDMTGVHNSDREKL